MARSQATTIALVVAGYFFISITMVFTNKLLMSSAGATIPAPLFVTWFQCVVTVGICWVLGELGKTAAPGSFLSQFPPVQYDLAVGLKVMKLSAMFVGMITYVHVVCVQVAAVVVVCRVARVGVVWSVGVAARSCQAHVCVCCVRRPPNRFLAERAGSTTCASSMSRCPSTTWHGP